MTQDETFMCHMLCGMAGHKVTSKARALGEALREARVASGLSLRKLGSELELDYSRLGKYERGEEIPKDTVVAQILTHLGVTGERHEQIIALTAGAESGRWLPTTAEREQHLAALINLEQNAETITSVSPVLIPGLLQDGGYIRAMMKSLPASEIATRVTLRIGRRDAITRRDPARFIAYVGEAALRHIIGNREVMLHQLEHLQQEIQRDNVEFRVVPFDAGYHPGLAGHFTVFDLRPEHGLGSVVNAENQRSGLLMQDEEDVADFRRDIEEVAKVAMSPEASAGLIADVITGMRTWNLDPPVLLAGLTCRGRANALWLGMIVLATKQIHLARGHLLDAIFSYRRIGVGEVR
ncbi:helix-turn-helix domain-containing protein [Amycolatopsis orientalis]|uniref:helix-turn-helix domain-containing protein n=1 Tax=Amycolatopsis orientalis TaxID=31958 RepID=UPI0011AB576A|nr:helix-turn-helix transcriptional regulator [Amycolatopsis orientalis]